MIENKLKHLEMLQAIISKMANNSFLLKGWSVVLVSAIITIAASGSQSQLIYLAYLPAFMFWTLDGYFLYQERLFRETYNKVRFTPDSDVDFSMDTKEFVSEVDSWMKVMFSKTLLIFHGVICLSITAIWLYPKIYRYLRHTQTIQN